MGSTRPPKFEQLMLGYFQGMLLARYRRLATHVEEHPKDKQAVIRLKEMERTIKLLNDSRHYMVSEMFSAPPGGDASPEEALPGINPEDVYAVHRQMLHEVGFGSNPEDELTRRIVDEAKLLSGGSIADKLQDKLKEQLGALQKFVGGPEDLDAKADSLLAEAIQQQLEEQE